MIAWPAVQDAQLHHLVGGDVGDELGAGLLEGGAAGGELVLDDPLDEVLAEDRPGVVDAEVVAGDLSLAVGGRGGDAVDHGVGEGDGVAHPGAKPASWAAARPATASRQTLPLCGHVVAGHDGEGREAGGAAGLEAGEDQAEDGLRVVRVAGVGDDRGALRVELAEGGVHEVAAFGDGQRDDAGRRVGEGGGDRAPVHGRQKAGHHAGDAGGGFRGRLLDDGREQVLARRARRASSRRRG